MSVADTARDLRAIAQRLADMSPILRVKGEEIRTYISDAFDQSKSAVDGSPWADLSDATLMERARKARGYNVNRTEGPLRHGEHRRTARRWTRRVAERVQNAVFNAKPERDTGRLLGSITYDAQPRSLSFGSNVIYAAKQNFGDPANKWRGHAAPLPARPFFPVTGPRGSQTLAPDSFWQPLIADIEHWLATGEVR